MRHTHRRDLTHKAIVTALRNVGAFVVDLADVGHDVPDALIAFRGRWFVADFKSGTWYGRRGLTPGQQAFADQAAACGVEVLTLVSVEDALQQLGVLG